jgi:hypothetical protein
VSFRRTGAVELTTTGSLSLVSGARTREPTMELLAIVVVDVL